MGRIFFKIYSGLNENVPNRLRYLNIWFPVSSPLHAWDGKCELWPPTCHLLLCFPAKMNPYLWNYKPEILKPMRTQHLGWVVEIRQNVMFSVH